MPDALDMQVPAVNVVADDLAQHYGKIVPQPAVNEEQQGRYQAQYPIDGRGGCLLFFFRYDPLDYHPGRKESLGQESERKYQNAAVHNCQTKIRQKKESVKLVDRFYNLYRLLSKIIWQPLQMLYGIPS